jgi:serine/threonine-protein kinase
MSLPSQLATLFDRHGPAVRGSTRQVLQAVLAGGPPVIELVTRALDAVSQSADDRFALEEARLPPMTPDDRGRLEQLLDLFVADLPTVLAQAAALENLPEAAAQVLEVTLATDARFQAAVGRLDRLTRSFDVLAETHRRLLLARGYAGEALEALLPLLRRTAGVGDLVEDLRAAGVGTAAFRDLLHPFQAALRALAAGEFTGAANGLGGLLKGRPGLAAAEAALAAASAARHCWPDAEQALARAAALRPQDVELTELVEAVRRLRRQGDEPTREVSAASQRSAEPAPGGGRVVLEVVAGPHQGARFEFDRHDTFIVGRAATANLQLIDDAYFSRHHFLLEFNPPRCYLRDLGSSNGTRVNGQKIAECFLRDGDVISGGKTRIRVRLAEPASPTLSRPGPPVGSEVGGPTPATAGSSTMLPPAGESAARAVPGFEITRGLGQGGMGVVYLARRLATGERCALKIILPESAASERAMQLFLREVSVLSRLDHPRVVRFHEMGIAQGQFFFAMEYVEAVDIADRLARAPEADRVRTSCAIACQVLEGLGYAHAQGFIHRDIKPANVLVAVRDGRPQAKLADFGLAKNFENAGFSGMTYEGQMRGTPTFMAPEQVRDSRSARPAVDLYSVGATLYQYLTGCVPYDFSRPRDRLAVILEDEPVPLARWCPSVPEGLAEAVHRALAKDPAGRFPTAQAMREALLPFAGGADLL